MVNGVDCVDCSNNVVSVGVVALIEVVSAMVDSATTKITDYCNQYSLFSIIIPLNKVSDVNLFRISHSHLCFI